MSACLRVNNETVIRLSSENNLVVGSGGCIVLNRSSGGGSGSINLAQLSALLSSFDKYQSDEDAILDGLSAGDWYIAAVGHVEVSAGLLRQLQ
jgi:hypothetical protein